MQNYIIQKYKDQKYNIINRHEAAEEGAVKTSEQWKVQVFKVPWNMSTFSKKIWLNLVQYVEILNQQIISFFFNTRWAYQALRFFIILLTLFVLFSFDIMTCGLKTFLWNRIHIRVTSCYWIQATFTFIKAIIRKYWICLRWISAL